MSNSTLTAPVILPIAAPPPTEELTRVFEASFLPGEQVVRVVVECQGTPEAVATIRVRLLRVVG